MADVGIRRPPNSEIVNCSPLAHEYQNRINIQQLLLCTSGIPSLKITDRMSTLGLSQVDSRLSIISLGPCRPNRNRVPNPPDSHRCRHQHSVENIDRPFDPQQWAITSTNILHHPDDIPHHDKRADDVQHQHGRLPLQGCNGRLSCRLLAEPQVEDD